jgi:phosphoglucosamine mutase
VINLASPQISEIFRTNDIRGVYGHDITEEIAEKLGRAFGTFLGSGKKVAIGRDVRNSGESLKSSFVSGLQSTGCDVTDFGIVTTPMLLFAVARFGFDAGSMVTASHNPPEWNGFKLVGRNGVQYHTGSGLEIIKEIFITGKFRESEQGKYSESDINKEYDDFILSKIKVGKKMKIVLDPGNGATCVVAERVFRKAGHDVIVINGNPDGSFPSRPSEPSEKNLSGLKRMVVESMADMGMAFDGDGDRLALVDGIGRYVQSGNVTIPIFARYYLSKNRGAKVVYDVCCSSCVENTIKEMGGIPVMSKVGQPAIRSKMVESGAIFGGEFSSHLNFSEIFTFDDAIFAGLKMAEIVSWNGKSLAEIVDSIPIYPTSRLEEMKVNLSFLQRDGLVRTVGNRLKESGFNIVDIDGVKAFANDGWVLIRASNTQPTIKINAEGKTKERADGLLEIGINIVKDELSRRGVSA